MGLFNRPDGASLFQGPLRREEALNVRFPSEPPPVMDPNRWVDGSEGDVEWMSERVGPFLNLEVLQEDLVLTETKYKSRCEDLYWDGDRQENGYESVGDEPDPRESAVVSLLSGEWPPDSEDRDEADQRAEADLAHVFPHRGLGSGVMLTDRHVLTAAHVVVDAFGVPYPWLTVCTTGNRHRGSQCILVLNDREPIVHDITPGIQVVRDEGDSTLGSRVTPDPRHSPLGNSDDRSHDIAIVRLPYPFAEFPGVMCLSNLVAEEDILARSWRSAGYPGTKFDSCVPNELANPPADPYSAHREDPWFWSFQMQRTKRAYSGWKVKDGEVQYKGIPYVHGASGSPVYHCGECRSSDHGWVIGVMSAAVPHGAFLGAHYVGHNPLLSARAQRRFIVDNLDGEIDESVNDQCWRGLVR